MHFEINVSPMSKQTPEALPSYQHMSMADTMKMRRSDGSVQQEEHSQVDSAGLTVRRLSTNNQIGTNPTSTRQELTRHGRDSLPPGFSPEQDKVAVNDEAATASLLVDGSSKPDTAQ